LQDLPSGLELLALGRCLLLDELLPLLPSERQRELRLVATAIAVTRREAIAGEGPARDVLCRLIEFYGRAEAGPRPSRPHEGGRDARGPVDDLLLRRFAGHLRNGAFETSGPRERAARAILWRVTVIRLRAGNPDFLAANGFA